MEDLAEANSAKWWKQTKRLTGQVSDKSNEWFHRFIGLDQFHDCLALANGINDFILSHSFHLLSIPQLSIVSFQLFFFFLSEREALKDLVNLPLNKAPGPDSISDKIFN